MGFQQRPDRGNRWYGKFQYNGQRKQALLAEHTDDKKEPANKKAAQAAFEEFKADVRSGKIFMPETVDKNITVAQFVEFYKTNYWNQDKRTGDGDIAIMNMVARYFDKKPLSTWNNPQTFIQFRNWLQTTPIDIILRKKDEHGHLVTIRKPGKKKRSAKTISDYRMRLRHMAEFAKSYKLIDENPFDDEKAMKFFGKVVKSTGRKRGVSSVEEQALLTACTKLTEQGTAMAERIVVAITLGPRRAEMQRAQLKDIDFDTWVWTLPGEKEIDGKPVRNTKNGQTRELDIPTPLQPMFKSKRALFNPDAFLFGEKGEHITSFKNAWALVKKHAKLDDVTLRKQNKVTLHWHDLRGEAATRMLDLGIDIVLVADYLGHTVEVLRRNYKGELRKRRKHAVALLGGAR